MKPTSSSISPVGSSAATNADAQSSTRRTATHEVTLQTMVTQTLPLNAAARNVSWRYPVIVTSPFAHAPELVEMRSSYEVPDFDALPVDFDLELILYGGLIKLTVDGSRHRIYLQPFVYIRCEDDRETRVACAEVWKRLAHLTNIADLRDELNAWFASYEAGGKTSGRYE